MTNENKMSIADKVKAASVESMSKTLAHQAPGHTPGQTPEQENTPGHALGHTQGHTHEYTLKHAQENTPERALAPDPEQTREIQSQPISGSHLYKANHIRRLLLSNGTTVLPDADGIFTATTQEEYDYLENLAKSPTSSVERISSR